MGNSIQVIEKPDWISWDDIHNVLWTAHEKNRENGLLMRSPSISGDEIRKRIEGKGKMFCAIDNGKVVATSAIVKRRFRMWYDKERSDYAYFCLASVLPEYAGKGIYKQFYLRREAVCKEMGLDRILFDTHEKNTRVIKINRKNGYVPVDYKFYRDHFNIVMVKWLAGCPFSSARCKFEFYKRKIAKIAKQTKKAIQKTKSLENKD